MADAPLPACEARHGCITCGDEALPRTVVRVDGARGLALCADGDGARTQVEIALLDGVAPGDVLLVHAGVAIAHAAEEAR
jgi:hydrogenase maturation factor